MRFKVRTALYDCLQNVPAVWSAVGHIQSFYIFRKNKLLEEIFPSSWLDTLFEKELSQRFDHELYGLKPEHRASAQVTLLQLLLKNDFKAFSNLSKNLQLLNGPFCSAHLRALSNFDSFLQFFKPLLQDEIKRG